MMIVFKNTITKKTYIVDNVAHVEVIPSKFRDNFQHYPVIRLKDMFHNTLEERNALFYEMEVYSV